MVIFKGLLNLLVPYFFFFFDYSFDLYVIRLFFLLIGILLLRPYELIKTSDSYYTSDDYDSQEKLQV